MKAIIHNIIGPYKGPFAHRLITYKLRLPSSLLVAWHENGKRGFVKNPKIGDVIEGLVLDTLAKRPNYRKSKLKLLTSQTQLF